MSLVAERLVPNSPSFSGLPGNNMATAQLAPIPTQPPLPSFPLDAMSHGAGEPSAAAIAADATTAGDEPSSLVDASSIIAHSPSTAASTSSPASSSLSNAPSSVTNQVRRAACTHTHLTRIYGPYKCHHCGRVPRLGWVYRCTQDFGDDLAGFEHRAQDGFASVLQRRLQQESEARAELEQHPRQDLTLSPPNPSEDEGPGSSPRSDLAPPSAGIPELKPWMRRLVDENFYTPEQVIILQGQRQQVLDRIRESRHPRPFNQLDLKDAIINDPTSFASAGSLYYNRRYRNASQQAPLPSRPLSIAPFWQKPDHLADLTNRQLAPQPNLLAAGSPNARESFPSSNLLRRALVCNYQTCSTCRPASRERTWACLHPSHLSIPPNILRLPNPSVDNRPISHPALVMSACYKVLHPEHPLDNSGFFTSEDDYYDDYDDDDLGYDSSEISPDISSGVSLEGTPTSPQFDETRGWDSPAAAAQAPRYRYHPTVYSQGRVLKRASSMDPRLLRSMSVQQDTFARNSEGTGTGLGLGLGIGQAGGAAMMPTAHEMSRTRTTGSGGHMTVDGWFRRPGSDYSTFEANVARPADPVAATLSAAAPMPAPGRVSPGQLSRRSSSDEVRVESGIAVTEEAVEAGEPDIIMQADPERA